VYAVREAGVDTSCTQTGTKTGIAGAACTVGLAPGWYPGTQIVRLLDQAGYLQHTCAAAAHSNAAAANISSASAPWHLPDSSCCLFHVSSFFLEIPGGNNWHLLMVLLPVPRVIFYLLLHSRWLPAPTHLPDWTCPAACSMCHFVSVIAEIPGGKYLAQNVVRKCPKGSYRVGQAGTTTRGSWTALPAMPHGLHHDSCRRDCTRGMLK
jgi:hypothetical protein